MSSGFYNAEMAAKQEQLAKTKDMVRQREEIIRLLSPAPGETILELGSGNGILVRELIEAVGPKGRVVGLDASEAILEMARHICPDGEFFHGDAQNLPFADNTFDAVVAAQVFCFLDNVEGAEMPLLNWSTVMYRKRRTENGEQAAQARGNSSEVAAG